MAARLALRQLALLAVASVAASSQYQWPNPRLEALDSLRWEQSGAHSLFIGSGVVTCSKFLQPLLNGNQTNAAEWLRTAYHDAATHDATAGTGGLDSSIRFELDRPENEGDGFDNTFSFTDSVIDRYVTYSDAIAVAAIFAVEACGGPQIDFRGGRVDATQAGPSGVPQPQDALTSHTAAFARMGFTPTEMIQLVACGHTMGGVQHVVFSDVVPKKDVNKKHNPDGNMIFDQTFDTFDNHITVAYVAGQSIDPLVVGPNVTTRSDARIFSSDGNVTMKALAQSPSLFASTCASLLARMLDTVPHDVILTDVIEPLPVKPADLTLIMHPNNNSFTFNGNVRFWNLNATSDATVRLLWADNSGKPCAGCSVQLEPFNEVSGVFAGQVGIAFAGNHTSLWFQIPQPGLSVSASGISSFWFEVTEQGKTWVENQDGVGFPLQTDVVLSDSSCTHTAKNGTQTGHIDVAVRKALRPSAVYVAGPSLDANGSQTYGSSGSWPAVLNKKASRNNSVYDIYSFKTPSSAAFLDRLNVGATIGGNNVTEWTGFMLSDDLDEC